MGTAEASRWQAEQMIENRIKNNHGRRTRKSTENEIKNSYVLRIK